MSECNDFSARMSVDLATVNVRYHLDMLKERCVGYWLIYVIGGHPRESIRGPRGISNRYYETVSEVFEWFTENGFGDCIRCDHDSVYVYNEDAISAFKLAFII